MFKRIQSPPSVSIEMEERASVDSEPPENPVCGDSEPIFSTTTQNMSNLMSSAPDLRSEILVATIPSAPSSPSLPDISRPYKSIFAASDGENLEQQQNTEVPSLHVDDVYDEDDYDIMDPSLAPQSMRRRGKEPNSVLLTEHSGDDSNISLPESMNSQGQNDTLYKQS